MVSSARPPFAEDHAGGNAEDRGQCERAEHADVIATGRKRSCHGQAGPRTGRRPAIRCQDLRPNRGRSKQYGPATQTPASSPTRPPDRRCRSGRPSLRAAFAERRGPATGVPADSWMQVRRTARRGLVPVGGEATGYHGGGGGGGASAVRFVRTRSAVERHGFCAIPGNAALLTARCEHVRHGDPGSLDRVRCARCPAGGLGSDPVRGDLRVLSSCMVVLFPAVAAG